MRQPSDEELDPLLINEWLEEVRECGPAFGCSDHTHRRILRLAAQRDAAVKALKVLAAKLHCNADGFWRIGPIDASKGGLIDMTRDALNLSGELVGTESGPLPVAPDEGGTR